MQPAWGIWGTATYRRAMRPQTTLLLVERVLRTPLEHSLADQVAATTDLTMLLRTGGRERTDGEYEELLAAADFALECIISTQGSYSVVKSVAGTSAPR
jgi:O-methyltransferase domain